MILKQSAFMKPTSHEYQIIVRYAGITTAVYNLPEATGNLPDAINNTLLHSYHCQKTYQLQ
jgi:hypothetical protein